MSTLSEKSKRKIMVYIKGWFITFLFTMMFATLEWINIVIDFPLSHIIIPLLIGLIIWTMIYFGYLIIWGFVLFLGSIMLILAGVFLALVGRGCLLLAQYVLSDQWLTFTEDGLILFVMGIMYSLTIFVDIKIRKFVAKVALNSLETNDKEK